MTMPRQRPLRWQRRHPTLEPTPSPPTPPKNTYLEYASSQQLRSDKRLHSYERQQLRRQERENMRLLRKLSEIGKRKQSIGQNRQDSTIQQMYAVNMRSRRKQREKRDQTLQHQNDILVERIVRMRRHSSGMLNGAVVGEGRGSPGRRNPQSSSVLLPSIHQQYHYA